MLLRCLTTSGDRIAQIDLHICSSVFRPPLPCTRHQRRGIHAKIMALPKGQPTVSVEWLNANIRNVKVLDATWYLPTVEKDPVAEFAATRIPTSRFFDLEGISDHTSPLPHMLPTPTAFAAACDALGVNNDDAVVVYDRSGIFSAPRVWWTFRVMGHAQVAVLDGGWPAWCTAGLPIENCPVEVDSIQAPTRAARDGATVPRFHAALQPDAVRSLADMRALVASWQSAGAESRARGQIVDARPAARFDGTAPEPRAGMRAGHMPGAVNVPFSDMLTDGRLKDKASLRAVFAAAGVDPAAGPLVLSCGTGVTACGVRLGLAAAFPDVQQGISVYDGSWSEWGALQDVPVETST